MTRRRDPVGTIDTVPPAEAEDYPWVFAVAAQEDEPTPEHGSPQAGLAMRLTKHSQRDWSELIESVQQTGGPLFLCRRDTRT